MKNEIIISKFLSGNITTEESKWVEQMLITDSAFKREFERYREIWHSTGQTLPDDYDTSEEWEAFKTKLIEEAEEPAGISLGQYFGIAASVLLVITFTWILFPDKDDSDQTISYSDVDNTFVGLQDEDAKEVNVYTSDFDKLLRLPDETLVNLKVGSRLSYGSDFNESNRKIKLVGSASFEVTKDTTCAFEIYAGETVTRVVGTSFLLRAYPGEDSVSVMVRTGNVLFGKQNTVPVSLTKGDFAAYSRSKDSLDVSIDYIEEEVIVEPKTEIVDSGEEKRDNVIKEDKGVLTIDYDWKKNFLNLSKVEGKVVNESSRKIYGNVRLKVTYYTDKQGKKASTYFMLNEALLPGDTVEFSKTIMLDWFNKTSNVEVEIDTAEIN